MPGCRVMGVLNMTPDSFSDGGQYYSARGSLTVAYDRAAAMVAEGAHYIDVGGESTRPGAVAVGLDEELERVVPVIERITANIECIVSVDSSQPEVMQAAAAAGAGMLNDVRALTLPGAEQAALATGLPVCIMHMQGAPATMQEQPHYDDVVASVRTFLQRRVDELIALGFSAERLLVDPGFGFGKTLEHNLQLLRELSSLAPRGMPLLVGMSRKRMLGEVLDKPVDQRLFGGLAAATIAVANGATIVRTHDVAATVDAVALANAVYRPR